MSVVVPAYNRAHTITRALESVQRQRLHPSQVLVVDDASQDETAQLAEAAGAEVVRLTSNGGAAHARNEGIRAAREPWIAFLDSDDEWLPHHLSTLWPYTEHHRLISGGHVPARDGRSGRHGLRHWGTRIRLFADPSRLIFPDNPISVGGTLVSRAALTEVGGFDETLRISEDFDLWLRILERHPALVLPTPVYRYHVHAGQKTSDVPATRSAQLALLERYRDASWWDEREFHKRALLSRAEALVSTGKRAQAARVVLRGLLREPLAHAQVAAVLAQNSLMARIERIPG